MVVSGSRCRFAYGPADAIATLPAVNPDLIIAGSVFHAFAAATQNALSPNVIRRIGRTRRMDVEPEQRHRLESKLAVR